MKKVIALGILVSSFMFGLGPRAAAAAVTAPALEGTWIVEVSTDPSLPVGDFVALETYSRGGGLVTTNNLHRAIGVDVGQGTWERSGRHAYRVSILFFVFNADGSRAGSIEVSHTVRLITAQAYVGEGQATLRDTSGAVIASGRFTSAARKTAATQF